MGGARSGVVLNSQAAREHDDGVVPPALFVALPMALRALFPERRVGRYHWQCNGSWLLVVGVVKMLSGWVVLIDASYSS
jgi:hypothetical protein